MCNTPRLYRGDTLKSASAAADSSSKKTPPVPRAEYPVGLPRGKDTRCVLFLCFRHRAKYEVRPWGNCFKVGPRTFGLHIFCCFCRVKKPPLCAAVSRIVLATVSQIAHGVFSAPLYQEAKFTRVHFRLLETVMQEVEVCFPYGLEEHIMREHLLSFVDEPEAKAEVHPSIFDVNAHHLRKITDERLDP